MTDEEREGQQRIIDEALARLADEASLRGETFDPQSVNLAELNRMTGISRSRLRTLKKRGFRVGHGNKGKKKARTVLDGYTDAIDDQLRKGVTNSRKVFDDLRRAGYEGGHTSVYDYMKSHGHLVPSRRAVASERLLGNRGRRLTTGPGESYQMDWGFVNLVDVLGTVWKLPCFAMACHHCGAFYIEFFTNARQENLLIGMPHAFMALGVPKAVLTDNMKSVVLSRDGDGLPVWHPDYASFMKCVGFETKPCKPRHPYAKGRVERLVRYVKQNMLSGCELTNLCDLNEDALAWCDEAGGKYHKCVDCVPVEHHAEACAKVAGVLPVGDDEMSRHLCPSRKISFDGFVNYEGRRFGVPIWYKQKTCRVNRDGRVPHVCSEDLSRELSAHEVTWSRSDSFCEDQFAGSRPEEEPSQPVTETIRAVAPAPAADPAFARFDFGGSP